MLLEQAHDAEGEPARDQRLAALGDVAAVEDHVDDAREGRRASDPLLFERLDEARLGVAGLRAGRVTFRLDVLEAKPVTDGESGQRLVLRLVSVSALLVPALLVRLEEALERVHGAGRGELGAAAAGGDLEGDRGRLVLRVRHLAGHRALPDEVVEALLVAVELAGDLGGRAERLARRADRLVRLLGVLALVRVHPGVQRHGLLAVHRHRLRARRLHGLRAQRGRVGAHIGDEALLVESLRHAHRVLRAHRELASGLLLQRRGGERRAGAARAGLGLDTGDGCRARRLDRLGQCARLRSRRGRGRPSSAHRGRRSRCPGPAVRRRRGPAARRRTSAPLTARVSMSQ